MTMGPVQLIMLGFEDPQFTGEIKAELARLRDSDVVRLIDAVVIQKDGDGNVSMLEEGESVAADREIGPVAALIGLAEAETEVLAAAAAAREPDAVDAWMVDDLLPPGTAAAVALIEHRWAAGLREAISRANGSLLADSWISPDDLDVVGGVVEVEAAY